MTRRTSASFVALTALTVLATAVMGVAPVGARAASHPSALQQLIDRASAVRVQLNLAKAQLAAVQAEGVRLQHLVGTEQAVVAADRSAASAADASVAASAARLSSLESQGQAARQALVNRAVQLYEHPYQYAEILLSGAGSLQQLTDRQVLADAVQARTSDLVDAVRHQQIQERAAARDLAVTQAQANQRHQVATAEFQRLQTALASEAQVHTALQARVNDDDAQLAALQPQISALAASNTRLYRKQIAAAQALLLAGASPVLGPVGSFGLQWPIAGIVTQEFGHTGHPGIDIAAAYGSPIHAAGTGVVIIAGWEGGYGNYTCIAHGNGISTCYGHQSAIIVTVGQTVTRGQVIGAEGSTGYSTGPHVHFEVRVDGAVRNPRAFIAGNP